MTRRSNAEPWNDGMTWVEGERTNPRGDSVWTPLYCSKDHRQSKAMLVKLLKSSKGHEEFEDFRVVRPEEQSSFEEKSRAVARFYEGVRRIPLCPGCGSGEGLTKIKRGELPLWKCRCGRRWPRGGGSTAPRRVSRAKAERVERLSGALHKPEAPAEAPKRPLEARNRSARGSSRGRRS